MKRSRPDLDTEGLQKYIEDLQKCISLQYSKCKKRQQKFNKTLDSLIPLLESRGHLSSTLKHSIFSFCNHKIELARLEQYENLQIGVNSVVSDDLQQLETVLANMRAKPAALYSNTKTQSYKELLEEIIGEKPDFPPLSYLLDETTPDQLAFKASFFKESLKKFADSDVEENIQQIPREAAPAAPTKGKVGRPKGSTNKDRPKSVAQSILPAQITNPVLTEDEQNLLEKIDNCKRFVVRPDSANIFKVTQKKRVKIFGANSNGENSAMMTPELEEMLSRMEAKLEYDQTIQNKK